MNTKLKIVKTMWYTAVFYTVLYKVVDLATEIDDIWERSF